MAKTMFDAMNGHAPPKKSQPMPDMNLSPFTIDELLAMVPHVVQTPLYPCQGCCNTVKGFEAKDLYLSGAGKHNLSWTWRCLACISLSQCDTWGDRTAEDDDQGVCLHDFLRLVYE